MPFTRLRQSLIQPNGSITGSLLGTASYAVTSSFAMNGGSGGGSTPAVSVASLNNQTILYNFSSSQEATITGLTLTNNNWGVNVIEEWNSGSGDIFYPSCSLLLHFSGSNNSTTFTDSSPNNVVVSANGNVKITSSISKFGSGSGFFDGTGDYLSFVSGATVFGSSDFTIEFWANFSDIGTFRPLISRRSDCVNVVNISIEINRQSDNTIDARAYVGSTLTQITSTATTALNTWYHIATARSGSLYYLFINGNLQTSASITGTINDPGNTSYIGIRPTCNATLTMFGYLDEFRITKGVARYSASFVTQSAEFPNQLPQYETKYIGLVGGLNDTGSDYGVQKLDDSSLKIRKMSVSGTPISGSPVLSASVDRVYVNVLNYTNISAGSTLLGQTFTAIGSTSSYALSRSVVNPYEIVVAVDGAVQSFNNAYSVTSSTINFTENIPSGSLVDIRYLTTPNVNSASYALTASYALNAGSGGGSVSTGSIVNQTILYNVTTSQDNTITGLNLTGNKWSVTVVEEWNSGSVPGDIYYNSSSLLMHFSGSNGSTTFTDNSPSPKTITSNNGAAISTAQSKFGGTSGFFDGTDDYLSVTNSTDFDFGSGDFTIEYWEYRTTYGVQSPILSRNTIAYTPYMIGWNDGASPTVLTIYMSSNGASWNVASAVSMGTFTTNVWTHYAVTRNGNTFRTFQNGTQISTFTSSDTFPAGASSLQIGRYDTLYYFKGGYIDELRITKGVARYTGSFTVPNSAFPDTQGTIPQYETKYIGLVGGINDSTVDYGVEKLSDSSLKIRKMTASGQPLSGSGTLSASVDRVYVNVLNYENAVITGSISNAVTASFAVTSSFAQTTPSGKSIALSFILG